MQHPLSTRAPLHCHTPQAFEQELAALPGFYASPAGFILLACADTGEPVGCVGVRPLSANASAAATLQQQQHAACQPGLRPLQLEAACEMKRLWVRRHCQRSGLGQALAAAAVDRARAAGYQAVVLDTLESLGAANRLYQRLGFARRHAPYCHNPLAGAVFWQLDLAR